MQKCHYCDFLSFPANESVREAYLEMLLAEIRLEAKQYKGYHTRTVFLGGGTPSLLEPEQIRRILDCVREHFPFREDGREQAEISMELNPGTVTPEKLAGYGGAGVNRLSIGLQSTNDSELSTLGRIHTYDMFLETYKAAVFAGFTNINVDLMTALPGQSIESCRQSLKKVLALEPAPTHISAYSLIVEEGTSFAKWAESGKLQLPSEEEEREMYELTGQLLTKAGYMRYEISNYAKKGYECRLNLVYWKRGNYLGFGLGAASMIDNVRMSNEETMQSYMQRIAAKGLRTRRQVLTVQDQMAETMFLGLRLMQGVSKAEFRRLYGCDMEEIYGQVLQKHVRDGLLKDGEYVALTPKGIDISNYVMADFLL